MGCAHMEWVYWQEQQSRNFTISVALWCLLQMAPNLHGVSLHEGEATFQIWIRSLKPFPRYESANCHKFFFFVFSPSFHTLCKNYYSSRMCASICLIFGTRIGGQKANTSIKFGANLINNEEVISDFMHKAKSNFCQAYSETASKSKLKKISK